MQPKHLLRRPNIRYAQEMPDQIITEMTQEISFLALPADYLMAGLNGAGGSSSPKGNIEESRDESGLGSGAGADPLKDPEADQLENFKEGKDKNHDDGISDEDNPNVTDLSPTEDEDNWGDIGAGMG